MISVRVKRRSILPLSRFQRGPKVVNSVLGLVGPKAALKHPGSRLTNAQIGVIHELGTSRIPARHWFQISFKAVQPGLLREYRKLIKSQLANKRPNLYAMATSISKTAQRRIRLYMTRGPHFRPALSPSTIARKRKTSIDPTRPVFETGMLAAAVEYQIIGQP